MRQRQSARAQESREPFCDSRGSRRCGGLEAVWVTRGLKGPLKKIAGREGGETRNVRQSHLAIAAVGEVIHVKLT